MILLNPNDATSTMYLVLRKTGSNGSVVLTIEEDGGGESESFTIAPNLSNDNYDVLSCAFTILKENTLYSVTVKSAYTLPSSYIGEVVEDDTLDYTILWRGKAYSTSNSDYVHSMNDSEYTINTINDTETYTIHR